MYIFNFRKISKIGIIGIFILIFCSSCFRINHQTKLVNKDEKNLLLYHQDSTRLVIFGSMDEWNDYIIDNNRFLKDSNYVRLEIRTDNLDTIAINRFNVTLWRIKDGVKTRIEEGRIYWNPEAYLNEGPFVDIKDTLQDSIYSQPPWNLGVLLVVKSAPSIEIEKADKFLVDFKLDCIIDGKELLILQSDTLYKKPEWRSGISLH